MRKKILTAGLVLRYYIMYVFFFQNEMENILKIFAKKSSRNKGTWPRAPNNKNLKLREFVNGKELWSCDQVEKNYTNVTATYFWTQIHPHQNFEGVSCNLPCAGAIAVPFYIDTEKSSDKNCLGKYHTVSCRYMYCITSEIKCRFWQALNHLAYFYYK